MIIKHKWMHQGKKITGSNIVNSYNQPTSATAHRWSSNRPVASLARWHVLLSSTANCCCSARSRIWNKYGKHKEQSSVKPTQARKESPSQSWPTSRISAHKHMPLWQKPMHLHLHVQSSMGIPQRTIWQQTRSTCTNYVRTTACNDKPVLQTFHACQVIGHPNANSPYQSTRQTVREWSDITVHISACLSGPLTHACTWWYII